MSISDTSIGSFLKLLAKFHVIFSDTDLEPEVEQSEDDVDITIPEEYEEDNFQEDNLPLRSSHSTSPEPGSLSAPS